LQSAIHAHRGALYHQVQTGSPLLHALDLAVRPPQPNDFKPPPDVVVASDGLQPREPTEDELAPLMHLMGDKPAGLSDEQWAAMLGELADAFCATARSPDKLPAIYIPELFRAVRHLTAALVLVNQGQVVLQLWLGTLDVLRTMQSYSKVMAYARAFDADARTRTSIGMQGSRKTPFNQPLTKGNADDPDACRAAMSVANLSKAEEFKAALRQPGGRNPAVDRSTEPANPYYNFGALSVVALTMDPGTADPGGMRAVASYQKLLRQMADDGSGAAPNIGINWEVYRSELTTSPRNLLYAQTAVEALFPELSPEQREAKAYDVYTHYILNCATEMDAMTQARILATLANGGVNPITRQRVLSTEAADAALAQMCVAGVYESSETLHDELGALLKSGVGGSLAIQLKRLCSMVVWSVGLDPDGTSHLGLAFLKKLLESPAFMAALAAMPSDGGRAT